jgi:hypothetical protein
VWEKNGGDQIWKSFVDPGGFWLSYQNLHSERVRPRPHPTSLAGSMGHTTSRLDVDNVLTLTTSSTSQLLRLMLCWPRDAIFDLDLIFGVWGGAVPYRKSARCDFCIHLHLHFSFSFHHILHQVLSHRPNVSPGAHCQSGAFSDVLALTVVLVYYIARLGENALFVWRLLGEPWAWWTGEKKQLTTALPGQSRWAVFHSPDFFSLQANGTYSVCEKNLPSYGPVGFRIREHDPSPRTNHLGAVTQVPIWLRRICNISAYQPSNVIINGCLGTWSEIVKKAQ